MVHTLDCIPYMVYTLSENESENGKKWLYEADTKTVKIKLKITTSKLHFSIFKRYFNIL